MAGLRITGPDGGERLEVRPQLCGDRRAAGHLRIIERTPQRVVVHTRYDAGLVIEKHSHRVDELIYVLDGEIMLGERRCGAGTTAVLEKGTPMGPIVAGAQGAVLLEVFWGEPGHVSEDPAGFARLLEERGIQVLPEPDPSVPPQGRPRAPGA
jgi:quercetin dioxygenase-like cupin family protein